MMQNRQAQAQQNFVRALQIDSRAGLAANNLAWIYLEGNGSVEQAGQLAETAKQSLPDTSEVNDTPAGPTTSKAACPRQWLRFSEAWSSTRAVPRRCTTWRSRTRRTGIAGRQQKP